MEVNSVVYKAEGVVKSYPIGDRTVEILHGIDLEVFAGEFVMLIGPSGCGKSTFMYLLFGLEPPSTGTISLNGENIFKMNDDRRAQMRSKQIAMIHQQPIWIKALTVQENIAFPLIIERGNKKQAMDKANQLLKVLHLEHLGAHHPHELSVGEQQRCSFMRSLISDPDVLFADEPTGNLDTDSSVVVMELFKKINQQLGKTVIMVTHNLNHLPYATKVVSMIDGKIVNIETKSKPIKPPQTGSIIEAISSWHTIEHDKTTGEPELTPKPVTTSEEQLTTAKRLTSDIRRAAAVDEPPKEQT